MAWEEVDTQFLEVQEVPKNAIPVRGREGAAATTGRREKTQSSIRAGTKAVTRLQKGREGRPSKLKDPHCFVALGLNSKTVKLRNIDRPFTLQPFTLKRNLPKRDLESRP